MVDVFNVVCFKKEQAAGEKKRKNFSSQFKAMAQTIARLDNQLVSVLLSQGGDSLNARRMQRTAVGYCALSHQLCGEQGIQKIKEVRRG